MKSSPNQSLKCGNDGEKLKLQYEVLTGANNPNRGHPTYKRQAFLVLPVNPLQAFKMEQHFTLLGFSINEVFNAIKDQL